MRKISLVISILAVLAVLATACERLPSLTPTSAPAPATSGANFRFLLSDDESAIGDFAHLYVTITGIGLQRSGSDNWTRLTPDINTVDLKPLVGTNALSIWSGNITAGEYNKVFIYVSEVSGILAGSDNKTVEVKLPSNKLQISKPFTVSDNAITSFVYDITVIAAGNDKSGVKYILKPQIAESGADQEFNEIKPKEKQEREKERNELKLRLEGEVKPGAEVTLRVMDGGTPAQGATVTLNGQNAGTTGADGRLNITLPTTLGEVEIKATLGNKSGELEIELEPEEQEKQREWFEGTITAITQGKENSSPWTMTLAGVKNPVTVYVTELEGTPSVGARAKIEGVLKDNVIKDAEAEIKGPAKAKGKGKSGKD